MWTDEDMLTALHLRDHESMSCEDIGKRLSRTKGAVAGQFKRIRDDMKDDNGVGDGTMKPQWWKR